MSIQGFISFISFLTLSLHFLIFVPMITSQLNNLYLYFVASSIFKEIQS